MAAENAALSAKLDDAYFVSGLDDEEEGCADGVRLASPHRRQRLEEDFVYILLCVGEEEEALEVCEQLLARDSNNVTALKYKADALVCLERAGQVYLSGVLWQNDCEMTMIAIISQSFNCNHFAIIQLMMMMQSCRNHHVCFAVCGIV